MRSRDIDPTEFTRVMGLAARQAGVAAARFQGKVENIGKSVDREFLNSLHQASIEALSDIDLVAQEILLLALVARYPFVRLEPEEDTPTVTRFASNRSRYTVVIDPIDGTLNYLGRSQRYVVGIGLIEDDAYIASVVYFPAFGDLYLAVRDAGCHVESNGKTRRVRRGAAPNVVFRDTGASPEMIAALERHGFETERSGSSIVDTTCVATGAATAAVYQRSPSIRRCIGTLVSREAGGVLCGLDGVPYDCTRPDGLESLLVARDRRMADRVLEALDF